MKLTGTGDPSATIDIKKNYAPAGYGWRIDNIDFTYSSAVHNIGILGITYGVIDNCTFTGGNFSVFIYVYAYAQNDAAPYGGASWNCP